MAASADAFDAFFKAADLDRDGRISGDEAVAFLERSNLPKPVLAQVWMHADRTQAGFLGREEFYNALRLVTVAQSGRPLTLDLVNSALYGPAAAKIPPPVINSVSPVPIPNNAPPTQTTPAAQNSAFQGQQGLSNVPSNFNAPVPSVNPNHMRPPQPTSSISSIPAQIISQKPSLVGSVNPPRGATTLTPDLFGGQNIVNNLVGATSQVPTRGITPSLNNGSAGLSQFSMVGENNYLQTQYALNATPVQPVVSDLNVTVPAGNGTTSATLQTNQKSDPFSFISDSKPTSTAAAVSAAPHFPPKPLPASQLPKPTITQNQTVPKPSPSSYVQSAQSVSASDAAGRQSITNVSQVHRWPKITQVDIQKYTVVFIKVDKDRDGKITGEEARNLFLSWKLPRDLLRKVWDLSDQDKDGMLSFREFCTAVYLMERHREKRPLPDVLPDDIWADGILLPSTGQFAGSSSGPAHQVTVPPSVLPTNSMQTPSQIPVATEAHQAIPVEKPKSNIPVLEKHLLDQLSKEEQTALYSKFQEAEDAEKKVQGLEKEILESREKIEFYRSKMQELILYKSRCDNRVNEISERVSADKREVQSLAMKYEDKCKKVGDVASRLTLEEATFRDIQERKMELYNAISKLKKEGTDETFQERASKIQADLDELVKALSEQCKQYGLRSKPTTVLELPFGWQPGVQEAADIWDEDWDNFDDDGMSVIKELTVEVERPKSSKEKPSTVQDVKMPSGGTSVAKDDDDKVEKASVDHKADNTTEATAESHTTNGPAVSAKKDSVDNHSDAIHPSEPGKQDSATVASESVRKHDTAEAAVPHDSHSDSHSADPTFDHPEDDDGWNFGNKGGGIGSNADNFFFGPDGLPPIRIGGSKNSGGVNGNRPSLVSLPAMQKPSFDSVPSTPMQQSSFFDSSPSTAMQHQSFFDTPTTPMQQKSFFDSAPSTPMKQRSFFDSSVPSTPMQNSFGADSFGGGFSREQKTFFDSVPSTPTLNSTASPRFSEAGDDHSFDVYSQFGENTLFSQSNSNSGFSKFDSFHSSDDHSASDGGFSRFDSFGGSADHGGAGNSFARFDSFRSSTSMADSNTGDNIFSRYDSFNATEERTETFARFDSFRSSAGDHGRGFSFDDSDPFGSGPFKSSDSPKHETNKWSSF